MQRRVYGIETEYAIIFEPAAPHSRRPSARLIFDLIEDELKARFHTVPSRASGKRGLFLENGGLVSFETRDDVEGLVEMSTPECSSAQEATRYQSAFDALARDLCVALNRRLRESGAYAGGICFGKNVADGKGHTWGTHENYSVYDPSPPPGLVARTVVAACDGVWRCTIVLAQALAWALMAGLVPLMLVEEVFRRRWSATAPSRSLAFAAWAVDVVPAAVVAPIAFVYDGLLRHLRLRPFTDHLASFLATRPIWCGAGRVWLESSGDGMEASRSDGTEASRSDVARERVPSRGFTVSARAARVGCVASARARRGCMIDLKSLLHPEEADVRVARLEIVCGDANMSEMCVLMKLGVTGLLLRMIEEGERFDELQLADPVEAMHTVSADVRLEAPLRLAGRHAFMTALQIQRAYLRRATAFYASRETSSEERRLLAMWARTLDGLEHDPASLASQVDWIAKRALMREIARFDGVAPDDAEAALRATSPTGWRMRRFDLRYHELGAAPSPYDMLTKAGAMRTVCTDEERTSAWTAAPEDTRAARRAAYVRRCANDRSPRVALTWDRFFGRSRSHDVSLGAPLE